MFTGIIEETGSINRISKSKSGALIVVEAETVLGGIGLGDSISVNGVCLTAVEFSDSTFTADVSQETLDRTTLGFVKAGTAVNLERAATPSSRLGGHIVQGHVDCCGEFVQAENAGDFWTVEIGFPKEFAQYLVFKGSVAVEGISLTVSELHDSSFEIAVIPKTWEVTNLSKLGKGSKVNLEADVIAKYVERILLVKDADTGSEGITREKLRGLGIA